MKESSKNQWEDAIKQRVNSLYDLMRSENIEELEIKETDFYIYIKRKGNKSPVSVDIPAQNKVTAESAEQPCGLTVKSPIIGIFYRSPSPTTPPFVKEGDIITSGKTLCIVEAMKVMNEIKADFRMKIIKILVENGKPITEDQDLFLVEKD